MAKVPLLKCHFYPVTPLLKILPWLPTAWTNPTSHPTVPPFFLSRLCLGRPQTALLSSLLSFVPQLSLVLPLPAAQLGRLEAETLLSSRDLAGEGGKKKMSNTFSLKFNLYRKGVSNPQRQFLYSASCVGATMGEWQPSLPAGIWGRACVALGSGGAKTGFVLLPRGGRPQLSHCLSDRLPCPFSLGH